MKFQQVTKRENFPYFRLFSRDESFHSNLVDFVESKNEITQIITIVLCETLAKHK